MPNRLSTIAGLSALGWLVLACRKTAESTSPGAGSSSAAPGAGTRGAGGAASRTRQDARAEARPIAGTAGCSMLASEGPASSATNPAPTWSTVKQVLTEAIPGNPPCASADCHGAGGPNPFQLNPHDSEQMYRSITTTIAKDCGNVPIVTPGKPKQSALLTALRGPCSCSIPRMPRACDSDPNNNLCLPADYIAAIEQWIASGAPKP
jgi:hypothetical protein